MVYIGTMNTKNNSKINQLLRDVPRGVVLLSPWLSEQGYSRDLQKRYRRSHWLESIGRGAMVRAGDKADYLAAVYALQKQQGLSVHPGGRTALSLLGKSHYLEMSPKRAILFGDAGEKLPLWFKKYDWGLDVYYRASSFLPPRLGLTSVELRTFSVNVSGAARAMMECLYLAPAKQSLLEAFELMEGLNNLIPGQVQTLLERCSSVKVKRLFLYMSEKVSHEWFNLLDLEKIDLGKGKRSLLSNGAYIPKYQITVPRELESIRDEARL